MTLIHAEETTLPQKVHRLGRNSAEEAAASAKPDALPGCPIELPGSGNVHRVGLFEVLPSPANLRLRNYTSK